MSSFPDTRWGSEDSKLRAPAIAFSCTKLGSRLIRELTPLDRRLLLRSKGRFTILGPIGAQVMLLTTTGHKSGLPRTTPLVYGRRADDRLIVVGSNFGQGHHPAWTSNLIADPRAVVTIGGQPVDAAARLLRGDESARAYAEMAELAHTYAEYRTRTTRPIRAFELRPADSLRTTAEPVDPPTS